MNNLPGADILLSSFPPSLAVDGNKYTLARVIAEELQELLSGCDDLRIYSRMDELDEELLDILAFDFAVSWYLYNGTIATKRAQIKSCFYVRRYMGTKAALVQALCDLCPGSSVEEWFEYGGDPYYFRVILDVTEQRLPIVQQDVERYINIFKSLRSVLESNNIVYRTRDDVGISDKGQVFFINTPKSSEHSSVRAGVYPESLLIESLY